MNVVVLNYCDLFFDVLSGIFKGLAISPNVYRVRGVEDLSDELLWDCDYLFSYRHSIECHDRAQIQCFDHPSKKIIFYVYGGSDFNGAAKDIDGVTYLPMPATRAHIFDALYTVFFNGEVTAIAGDPQMTMNQFTLRQQDVIAMLMQGKSNKEISKELCISSDTVKTHISNIFRLLGVRSRAQVVAQFTQPLPKGELLCDR